MNFRQLALVLGILFLTVGQVSNAADVGSESPVVQISDEVLQDKIRGGLLAQILGNLNGLPHEFKYLDEPGNVANYVPSLPEGARTDDDTDLEWVIVSEIARSGQVELPPARIVELWKTHINRAIWCANRYARDLMEIGLEPPLTGSSVLNPWSEFNIAGQFGCESFGLMAPAMPQTASRIGLHYTRIVIDGEPAQATQLFTAMIATAFVTSDIEEILDAGIASVDPRSNVATIVGEVRDLHAQHPEDWRIARKSIKERLQVHNGSFRDQNGYELNTAATVAALLYGEGDLVETMQLAFNFGWDCDNNAATSGTILGVIKGRKWMDEQGWDIRDVYRNTTRDAMPSDETISGFENKLIDCARLVILNNDGSESKQSGQLTYQIRTQPPASVERLASPSAEQSALRNQFVEQLPSDLLKSGPDAARAAYLAICLGEADTLDQSDPRAWSNGLRELKKYPAVIRNLFAAPLPAAARIQQNGRQAGLEAPAIPKIDEQGWWQIAGNPDLGELTSDKQEPVDFGIWQAADGTWQLWSCIRNTKEDGVTRLFHRWEGSNLTDSNWKPLGIAMRADPDFGERRGGLQAPYVIRQGDKYLMFYGDWVNICLAESDDGKAFRRASIGSKGPQLFTEGEGNNARDAMLLEIDGNWHCYYSAMPGLKGAMFVRRSRNLRDWSHSSPVKVLSGGTPGSQWYQAECPHVVSHGGYFYLFRTSNYKGKPITTVYRSADPTDFGIEDDSKIVATLAVAAPEIIVRDGKYWLAALNPQLDGIRVTRLRFVPEQQP
ncbi:ADP-ribosylglycohydrolase family protein [Bythopirellula goksoeyrii]|uniref:ADP-ribosylglycohydrolase n=1 Tax=Bythopirellula goksoeyrii TaxID=1400387 RepID=A0A5B9QAN2_9BACT|nr:ADP-ribosylglycohydrolase family protein [Bythopirellula goksoeyrii]QEG33946.1 ADP-ribosylglycohydrolase [Bythopirellula goksoeyrii]